MGRSRWGASIGAIVAAGSLAACGSATPLTRAAAAPVHPSVVRPCTSAQLKMRYAAGGVGVGNNFGSVVVLDDSATECLWSGAVSVVPLNRAGQPLANAVVQDAKSRHPILLSAHGHLTRNATPPSNDRLGLIELGGDARDDPTSPTADCAPANEVTPAYWGVATEGDKYMVRNYDDTFSATNRNFFAGVIACHGHFDTVMVAASD